MTGDLRFQSGAGCRSRHTRTFDVLGFSVACHEDQLAFGPQRSQLLFCVTSSSWFITIFRSNGENVLNVVKILTSSTLILTLSKRKTAQDHNLDGYTPFQPFCRSSYKIKIGKLFCDSLNHQEYFHLLTTLRVIHNSAQTELSSCPENIYYIMGQSTSTHRYEAAVALGREGRSSFALVSLRLLLFLGLLTLASAGWIDTDTPLDKRTTTSFVDGTTYHLVR